MYYYISPNIVLQPISGLEKKEGLIRSEYLERLYLYLKTNEDIKNLKLITDVTIRTFSCIEFNLYYTKLTYFDIVLLRKWLETVNNSAHVYSKFVNVDIWFHYSNSCSDNYFHVMFSNFRIDKLLNIDMLTGLVAENCLSMSNVDNSEATDDIIKSLKYSNNFELDTKFGNIEVKYYGNEESEEAFRSHISNFRQSLAKLFYK